MARMPISRVWSSLYPAHFSADEIRRLREHALALVLVSRGVTDADLSAKLDVIAIEILTSAAKLERDNVAPKENYRPVNGHVMSEGTE
jgi:hypothetical protein